eukprot:TRINITY_DN3617_c0_g1_i1.p1 TRINITY_DN3617_c0_g1~~TRINITY_DN3617_c0_g1_i1.p1  ORF type:complete len:365 (-),score=81.12 TRINITY_DN3617_c0_g1_i1:209-1303(-)
MTLPHFMIQIVSDIHLEMRKKQETAPEIIPKAPFLALVGDIGLPRDERLSSERVWVDELGFGEQDARLLELGVQKGTYSEQYWCFLKKMSNLFQHVFVTTGNHEYYGAVLQEVDSLLHKMSVALGNVTFLNKTTYRLELKELDQVFYVAGGCLWSDIPENARTQVGSRLADYQHIDILDLEQTSETTEPVVRKIRVEDTVRIHHEHVKYIKDQIEFVKQEQEKELQKQGPRQQVRLIILTHHAPMTGSSAPRFEGQPMNSAFCSDLSGLMDGKVIPLWAFGHTHYSTQREVNGTLVVSNQMGYPFEPHQETRFSNNFWVHIPDENRTPWFEVDEPPPPPATAAALPAHQTTEQKRRSSTFCLLS